MAALGALRAVRVGVTRVPLRELAAGPWIVGAAESCCGAVVRAACAAAGFAPDIRHAVNDWSALTAPVETGAGVALVPRLVRPLYAHRRLAVRPVAGRPPSRNVFAAVRTGAEGDPVLGAVCDQLRLSAARLTSVDGPVPTTD